MHLRQIPSFLFTISLCLLVFVITGCGKGSQPEAKPKFIVVTGDATKNTIGNNIKLTATLHYDDTSSEQVTEKATWQSSDSAVASISDEAIVTCLEIGSADLTANYEDFIAKLNITCQDVPKIASLETLELANIKEKESLLFPITIKMNDESIVSQNIELLWKSSDESIATVDQRGIVTGVRFGVVNISVDIDREADNLKLKVREDDLSKTISVTVLAITQKVTLALSKDSISNPPTEDLSLDLILGERSKIKIFEHKTDGVIVDVSNKDMQWAYTIDNTTRDSSTIINLESDTIRTKTAGITKLRLNSFRGFSSENTINVRVEHPLELFVTSDSGSQVRLEWHPQFDSTKYRLLKRAASTGETSEPIFTSETNYLDTSLDASDTYEFTIGYEISPDVYSDDDTKDKDKIWVPVKPSLNGWVIKNEIPNRSHASSITIGDHIYLFGGLITTAGGNVEINPAISTNQAWRYNTLSHHWSSDVTDMNIPRHGAAICAIEEDVILFSGYNSNGTEETQFVTEIAVYHTRLGTWDIIEPPPTLLTSHLGESSCSSLGNSIYLTGGINSDGTVSNTVTKFEYNSGNIELSPNQLPGITLGTPRYRHESIVHDKLLFIVGGKTSVTSDDSATTNVEIINLINTEEATINYYELMPTARYDFSMALMGDNIFAFGGMGNQGNLLNGVEFFNTEDILTNGIEWKDGDPMPFENSSFTSEYSIKNNSLYVFGGTNSVPSQTNGDSYPNQVIYNGDEIKWKPLLSPDPTIQNSAGGFIGDNMYLIGGFKVDSSLEAETKISRATNTTQRYSTKENSWTSAAPLNTERMHTTTVSTGNLIFAIGGQDINESFLDTIEVFGLPDTPNNWVKVEANLSQPRASACAVFDKNTDSIFIFGGINNGALVDTIDQYNIVSGQLTAISTTIERPRAGLSCTSVRDAIYLIGGYDDVDTEEAKPTVEAFYPQTLSLDPNIMNLKESGRIKPALAVYNDRIYVFGGLLGSLQANVGTLTTQVYTTHSKEWELSSNLKLNQFSNNPFSAIVGNKIYVIALNHTDVSESITNSTIYVTK